MIGIVVSRADRASAHIGEHLLELIDWTTHDDGVYHTDGFELREFDAMHLDLDGVGTAFDPAVDLIVFASRHSGETGPLLTAHHTGNFGPAEHGGAANDLARACPNAHSAVLDALAEYAPPAYDVGMECTHHGPSAVGVPSLFVEVGSAEPQWNDPEAARAVARAILKLRDVDPGREPEHVSEVRRHLVGFGGGHYTPRFTRIVRETDWAVGHIAADWGLDAMGAPVDNHDLLTQAFAQSTAEFALVDGDYPELTTQLRELGYRVVGETWLRAVIGVPLALVDRLENILGPVSDGLRFGEPAQTVDPDTDFEVVELPAELLGEVQGIDGEETRESVADHTLAFQTEHGGTRATGRAAVTSTRQYNCLINSMISLLRDTYDTVERDDDVVVAREQAFDPATARDLGVPDGPKFGQLADGKPVQVDGTTVEPEQVRTDRVRRFSV